MAEENGNRESNNRSNMSDNNPGNFNARGNKPVNKGGNNSKTPQFNSNWIFAGIALMLIAVQLLFNSKPVEKTSMNEIKDMIVNHDIDRLVVVNKDQAQIYLNDQALESGRYDNLSKSNRSNTFQTEKPDYTFNIGDITSFETLIARDTKGGRLF